MNKAKRVLVMVVVSSFLGFFFLWMVAGVGFVVHSDSWVTTFEHLAMWPALLCGFAFIPLIALVVRAEFKKGHYP